MTELSRWKNIEIEQRYSDSCIAAGIEWLLKYLGRNYEVLTLIQDDFPCGSTFGKIKEYIEERVSEIRVYPESDFVNGEAKIKRIEDIIEQDIPCLMSVFKEVICKCHIMPVIIIDENHLITLEYISFLAGRKNEKSVPQVYKRTYIEWLHDNIRIGERRLGIDILWIELLN